MNAVRGSVTRLAVELSGRLISAEDGAPAVSVWDVGTGGTEEMENAPWAESIVVKWG